MIAALLFLAFAFFAVAQAGTVRNGGQTAADAAALGAAEDDRQQFFDGFLDALDTKDGWQDWLDAVAPLTGDGCGAAARFADRNRSDLLSCDLVTRDGDDGYRVRIETRFDTGNTVVPGTDNRTAKATATAVIRPRCEADDTGGSDDTDDPGDAAEEIELSCDGEELTIDPEDEGEGLKPSDLFSVVLVE
ncbi:hypothetical protein ITI46_32640 [Streptomyces oryzae]|uniref:Flp pilus-assembly TadG-like N-terminal domain-containing protein n=1 Tax=Streptomyces oryzae TaxID=1434886 RepID=A0ABS3XLT6_9ACTN|nr:hypothetical protein [Streptomyces oryzae]MBO8196354.1 hypothetical protein [Streptomyces oryzae]